MRKEKKKKKKNTETVCTNTKGEGRLKNVERQCLKHIRFHWNNK